MSPPAVDYRGNDRHVAESFRLVDRLEILDALLHQLIAEFAGGEEMLFLDGDVGRQLIGMQLGVAGQFDFFHFVLLFFGDAIEDGIVFRTLVKVGVDFHVEVPLGLEIRGERLAAFLHGFIIDADALVLGQERFASPGPDVRALDVDFDRRRRERFGSECRRDWCRRGTRRRPVLRPRRAGRASATRSAGSWSPCVRVER